MSEPSLRPLTISTMRPEGPRLNLATCDAVRADGLGRIAAGAEQLRIDMREIDFIDSSGVGALVALRKAIGDGRIELVNLRPFVSRVLDLTRTAALFELHEAPQTPPV